MPDPTDRSANLAIVSVARVDNGCQWLQCRLDQRTERPARRRHRPLAAADQQHLHALPGLRDRRRADDPGCPQHERGARPRHLGRHADAHPHQRRDRDFRLRRLEPRSRHARVHLHGRRQRSCRVSRCRQRQSEWRDAEGQRRPQRRPHPFRRCRRLTPTSAAPTTTSASGPRRSHPFRARQLAP